jgi:porin
MGESSHNLEVQSGGAATGATGMAQPRCHTRASCALTQHIASSPLPSFRHWSLRFVSSFIICHSSFALTAPVLSLDQPPAPSPPHQYPTGDWWGLRTTLANNGLALGGYVQLDVTKNLRGGADTDKTPTRYLLDLNATYDAAKFLPDATLFLDFQSHDGPNGSKTVGDIQGFDNMDAPHFVQIEELWYQQLLFDKQLRIKAGKIDINTSDFSIFDHGKEFLASAATYAVTNYPIITYPDPAPGVEFFYNPAMPKDSPHAPYVGFGAFYSNSHQTVLDIVGHPERVELTDGGSYLITELGDRWILHANNTDLPGHAAIGGWYHTGEFKELTNPTTEIRGTPGAYLFADQTLYATAPSQSHPKQDLGAFFSAGYTDFRTIPIQQNVAAGISATGFIPSRPNDIVGLFASWSHLSPTTTPTPHDSETAIETFYKLQLTPWASLKPDLQYIISPSGKYPDALAFTLRAEIDF